jgi:hypothetical protein
MPTDDASPGETAAQGNPLENPALLAAPQAIFAGLRARRAVAVGEQGYLVTRNEDVAALLTNPEVFSSGMLELPLDELPRFLRMKDGFIRPDLNSASRCASGTRGYRTTPWRRASSPRSPRRSAPWRRFRSPSPGREQRTR